MITTILISTVVAILGVIIGAKVQKACRFIYPMDAVTISLSAFMLTDSIFSITPLDPFWYLPFIAGYAAGYLVVGRTSYVMVWTMSLAAKHVDMGPWVTWTENGCTYLQEQSNRALFRRILFGVKHEVISDVPLDSDWVVDAKYPLFPLFSRPTVVAEDVITTSSKVHLFWKFHAIRYTTHVSVAYAGTVSKMQLAHDEQALRMMQEQNTDLINTVHELTSQQGPMLMEMALRLEQDINATTPANRMFDLIRFGKGNRRRKEKDGKEDPAKQTES